MEQQAVDLVKQSDSTILITIAVIVFLAVIAVPSSRLWQQLDRLHEKKHRHAKTY